MSRQNKVNPDHYTIAGRLSPDDLARERWKPIDLAARGKRKQRKPQPPWITREANRAEEEKRLSTAEPAREGEPEPATTVQREPTPTERATTKRAVAKRALAKRAVTKRAAAKRNTPKRTARAAAKPPSTRKAAAKRATARKRSGVRVRARKR